MVVEPGDEDAIPVVIYAAKSTADVRASIPTQLTDCRSAVERDGGREVVGEYSDEAASAYRGNRGAGLKSALRHAERLAAEGRHPELWVQHSDRLARGDGRKARHLLKIVLWALETGVRLRSVQDSPTFGGEGMILAAAQGDRNHEDSRRKSLSVQSGKLRRAQRGELMGGPTPDGYVRLYTVAADGRKTSNLEGDPERAPIIRRIFALAEAGVAPSDIA